MNRPKIYVLHAHLASLQPTSGDRIETIRFMKTLSQFGDVFYNDDPVLFDRPDLGLTRTSVELPQRNYDLYYVRANHEIFRRLPGPKITMAYPYDPEIYAMADAIVVTTSEWKRLLQSYNSDAEVRTKLAKWYPADQIVMPRHIVNIRQTIEPAFDQYSRPRIELYRAKMTNGKALATSAGSRPKHCRTSFFQIMKASEKSIRGLLLPSVGILRALFPPRRSIWVGSRIATCPMLFELAQQPWQTRSRMRNFSGLARCSRR